ncbi:MAG: lipid A deacylase LpxR family protein [Rhodospirillales bacterium]|nr:lipid A deacylase LpxR family protein [Rhodospirillales bacterium]
MRKSLIFLVIVLFVLPAGAQEAQETQEESAQFWTLAIENDSIGGGTDHNYTSGVRLSYFDVGADFPDFAYNLADHVPTFSINETSSIFYTAGQNIFTPNDIRSRTQDPKDRPWAAFLYASMGMATLTSNHVDELEATLGVVGPWALGEQAQKFVHRRITDSPRPRGWDNQLKNEPGVILSWRRRWPWKFSHETHGLLFSAGPHIGVSLGNIYTYADTGLGFRISPASDRWEDTPLRVRPAMPGTGYFEKPENGLGWYIFGGVDGRAVARNIFLDGNSFRDSHSVDKLPLVGDANAGVAFTLGPARLSYTVVYRTREFDEQSSGDVFGAVSLSYRF